MNSSLSPLADVYDKALLLLHALNLFMICSLQSSCFKFKDNDIKCFKENTWVSGQKPVICLLMLFMNYMFHSGFSSPSKAFEARYFNIHCK